MNVTVYLSGGTHSNWQDKVIKGIEERKKKDEVAHVHYGRDISYVDPRRWKGRKNAREYLHLDFVGILGSRIVFAYLEKDNPSGVGLALEIGWACAKGKVVIFVNEKKDRYFNIVSEMVHVTFESLEEGIDYLYEQYLLFRGF